MSENPGSNEISSKKGSRSIEVYFPILFYKYFGTLNLFDYWPLNGGWPLNRWPLNGGSAVYRVG